MPSLPLFGFFVFLLADDPLERFLQSFHRMKAFWVQMIDLDLFLRYLKGRCHGNQFCEKKLQTPHIRRSGIQKWNGISLPQCAH